MFELVFYETVHAVYAGHLNEVNIWGTFYPDVRVFVL